MLKSVDKPKFNQLNRCKATGWFNNCGVNCFSHLIAEKLQNGELQKLYAGEAEYVALRKAFQEYYGLSRQISWDEINRILTSYPDATDKEAILGPVLRLYLAKLIEKTPDFFNSEYLLTLEECAVSGHPKDITIPFYKSNKFKFDELIKKYREGHAQKNRDLKLALKTELTEYWKKEGCARYAQLMGRLEYGEMLNASNLILLGNSLKIGVEIHTRDGLQHGQEQNFPWQLKLYNGGLHWEYQEWESDAKTCAEKVKVHNRCYDFNLHSKQSQFKIIVHGSKGSLIDRIRATIKEQFESIAPQQALAGAAHPAPAPKPLNEEEQLKEVLALSLRDHKSREAERKLKEAKKQEKIQQDFLLAKRLQEEAAKKQRRQDDFELAKRLQNLEFGVK